MGPQPVIKRSADVGGIGTHWLECGAGPVVLLLHGGAWGESAETTWPAVLPALADLGFRVIAPDWLGFGGTDKLRDFVDLPGRMLDHVAALLRSLDVTEIHTAVGLSMGGSHLLRELAAAEHRFAVGRAVLVSAGGIGISGAARERFFDYDGSVESMQAQVALATSGSRWSADEEYVGLRHETSLRPGAYEWFASLALRSPSASPPPPGDPVPYERLNLPVLVIAGADDQLKSPGWAAEIAARMPDARVVELPGVGHLPPLEAPDAFIEALREFLAAAHPTAAPAAAPTSGEA